MNDNKSSSESKSSDNIIDLCSPDDISDTVDFSSTDEDQLVTPSRPHPYNVVADIQNAIIQRSFSAMYPDDNDSTTTPNNPVLSVITPLVDKYLGDVDNVTDELPSERRNLSIELEGTSDNGYH